MKRLTLLFLILLSSCVQEVVEPILTKPSNIFSQKETVVLNGEEITFELEVGGIYFITLVDIETSQVLTKEKIVGIKGINNLNIYTKSIESRYLYLVLSDNNRKEIIRTTVIF
jgi:hypothetical protein